MSDETCGVRNRARFVAGGRVNPFVERLVAEVAETHGVAVADILGRSRSAPFVAARHAVWARLRVNHGWSWPAIGREFDRDHTTVMYGVRSVLSAAAVTHGTAEVA